MIDVRNALASLTLKNESLGDRRYLLHHLHFHWGSNDHIGSEHQFNGRSFPAEVSYNKEGANMI